MFLDRQQVERDHARDRRAEVGDRDRGRPGLEAADGVREGVQEDRLGDAVGEADEVRGRVDALRGARPLVRAPEQDDGHELLRAQREGILVLRDLAMLPRQVEEAVVPPLAHRGRGGIAARVRAVEQGLAPGRLERPERPAVAVALGGDAPPERGEYGVEDAGARSGRRLLDAGLLLGGTRAGHSEPAATHATAPGADVAVAVGVTPTARRGLIAVSKAQIAEG